MRPIKPSEFEIDSEDELPIDWLVTKSDLQLQDLSYLNQGEREYMKLWNLHVLKDTPLGFGHLNTFCIKFAKANKVHLKKLRNNFACHLIYIVKVKLITSSCMLTCLKIIE
jgi:hypothetical protein